MTYHRLNDEDFELHGIHFDVYLGDTWGWDLDYAYLDDERGVLQTGFNDLLDLKSHAEQYASELRNADAYDQYKETK